MRQRSVEVGPRNFEKACREQNEQRAREVAKARAERKPCEVVDMLAFECAPYCRVHHVAGPCPYGGAK